MQLADIAISGDLHEFDSLESKKALIIADLGFRAAGTKASILIYRTKRTK
ncbi:MAG: hypothetical protein JJE04_15150 [Acidobacteriia bacterium]|nr:hypothetical protein [Terriglobia bacterium]